MTPVRLCLSGLIFTALLLGAGTSMAPAANISYVGADGNVWRMAPDGSPKQKLTTGGSPGHRYVSPSQEDDGTVVAIRKVAGTSNAFADFIRPGDRKLIDSWNLPKAGAGSFVPYSGGEISPGGSAFIYDWHYFDCGTIPCSLDERSSVISGGGVTDPCLVLCYSGYARPRWIPGTSYAGFVNAPGFDWVWIQNGSTLVSWLGFANPDDGALQSFDVASNGTSVVEVTPEGGHVSDFQFFTDNGTPPGGSPALRCKLVEVANTPAYPRFSPDGSMIAWQSGDGVHVSPTPTQTEGGACVIRDRLAAPGGKEPAWGPATLSPSEPGTARLRLVARPRRLVFRPGKPATFRVTVSAFGDKVTRLRVCAHLPRRMRARVRLSPCRQLRVLNDGQSRTFRFTARTTRMARGTYPVEIQASATGLHSRVIRVLLKAKTNHRRRSR